MTAAIRGSNSQLISDYRPPSWRSGFILGPSAPSSLEIVRAANAPLDLFRPSSCLCTCWRARRRRPYECEGRNLERRFSVEPNYCMATPCTHCIDTLYRSFLEESENTSVIFYWLYTMKKHTWVICMTCKLIKRNCECFDLLWVFFS